MNSKHECTIIVLLFGCVLFSNVSSQYYITDGIIPSYMHRKFNFISEEVFPRDIRINMSLSRIAGTLLYSIDKNLNQLIVSLHESMSPTLKIEINKQILYASLSELCGCEKCRYEILDLRFQVTDKINLQCNGGDVKIFEYIKTRDLNQDYHIPYSNKERNEPSANAAHLWLVNTPEYEGKYPNSAQLSGCIFNVLYRSQEIIFTNITSKIKRKCNKTCNTNVCNGGQCYEAFNGKPICNCTKTFMNGDYCNDKPRQMNKKSLDQFFMFDMFKLSWSSSTKEILDLNNSNTEIRLTRDESFLYFECKYKNGYDTILKGTLSKTYVPNVEYILVVSFYEKIIDIRLFINGKWEQITLLSSRDLRREAFDTVILYCGTGYNDMAYKTTPNEYKWRKIEINNYQDVKYEEPKNNTDREISNKDTHRTSKEGYFVMVIITISIVLVLALSGYLLLVLFYIRVKRKESWLRRLDKCRNLKGISNSPVAMTPTTENETQSSINAYKTPMNSVSGSTETLLNETGFKPGFNLNPLTHILYQNHDGVSTNI